MTVPSASDSSGDTRDISDTGNASWQTNFSMYVYIVVGWMR